MLRIRTVKPELFYHEALFDAEMSVQLPLRLAFIGLFTCCDREGRFKWRVKQLKHTTLPYDDVDMSQILDALAIHGFLVKYQVGGELYGCIPSWSQHQSINNKEKQSVLPSPHEGEIIEGTLPSTQTSISKPKRASKSCEKHISKKATDIVSSQVKTIFEHWKVTLNHPNAKLDRKRIAVIKKALKLGYMDSQLCEAITGCSLTPYILGDNNQGQRYDSIELILRDAEHIDRFLHNASHPPKPQSKAQQKMRRHEQVITGWVNKKMHQSKSDQSGHMYEHDDASNKKAGEK